MKHISDVLNESPVNQILEFSEDKDIAVTMITSCLRKMSSHPEWLYYQFKRKSKNGKKREFFAAKSVLKNLQNEVKEKLLTPLLKDNCSSVSHSNRKGKSIKTASLTHLWKEGERIYPTEAVLLDLKDAFPHVSANHIYNSLWYALKRTGEDLDYWKKKIEFLIPILSYDKKLPLGPSTSPAIFELSCLLGFDQALEKLGRERGLIITRYVDDIAVTSKEKIDPEEIFSLVNSIAEKCKFELNKKKLRHFKVKERNNTFPMLGLVLDIEKGELRLKPDLKNEFRAAIYNFISFLESTKERKK